MVGEEEKEEERIMWATRLDDEAEGGRGHVQRRVRACRAVTRVAAVAMGRTSPDMNALCVCVCCCPLMCVGRLLDIVGAPLRSISRGEIKGVVVHKE